MPNPSDGVSQEHEADDQNLADVTSGAGSSADLRAEFQEFTEVDGVRVYGKKLDKQTDDLVATLQAIETGPESELHIARHFTALSGEYRESLVGQSFERQNHSTGETETVIIDEDMIDQALATKGSKFFEDSVAITNPRELIEFVKEKAIEKAQADDLPVFDGGFCEKMMFSITMDGLIGRDGLVATDKVDSAEVTLSKQPRGKLGGDDFLVNIAEGHPGIESDKLSVVIGVIGGTPYIFTAYPGELAPDFPKDHQETDELEYHKEFWDTHAFIG